MTEYQTARERYDTMVRDAVWPALKARGFKRAKNTFRRRNEASWTVINFQASQYSFAHDVKFTVNLGVSLDLLRPEWQGDKPPSESGCRFRERLSFLLPDRIPYDWWWVADDETNFERLGADITTAIVEHGLSWLDARSTPEQVRDLWLGDLEHVSEKTVPEALKIVDAIGPPSAREVLEKHLAWASTPDGRSALYTKWGQEERARPRPEGEALIFTR